MSSRNSSYLSMPQGLPRQVITRQLASNTLAALHRRYNLPGPPNQSRPLAEFRATASKAMDFLRQNIQASVSKEIDDVIRKYLEKFFVPAVANIRSNLGDDSVGEDQVRAVCRAMLDGTRTLYAANPRPLPSPSDFSDTESLESKLGKSTNSLMYNKRHWETDADTGNTIRRKRFKPSMEADSVLSASSGPPSRPPSRSNVFLNKWNPERLNETTIFVMGAHAHKLLGLGQSRGRLYTKHADIMRYPADIVDKEWIANNGLMNPIGGRPYIMVLEDIEELAASEQYRGIADLSIPDVISFRAPPFMLSKMKAYLAQKNILAEPMSPLSPSPSTYLELKAEPLKTEIKEEGGCIEYASMSSNSMFSIEQVNLYEQKNDFLHCFEPKDEHCDISISSGDVEIFCDVKEQQSDTEKENSVPKIDIKLQSKPDFNIQSYPDTNSNSSDILYETKVIPVEFSELKKLENDSYTSADTEFLNNYFTTVVNESNDGNALECIAMDNSDINLTNNDFEFDSPAMGITDVVFTPPFPPSKSITILTKNGASQNIPVFKCTKSSSINPPATYSNQDREPHPPINFLADAKNSPGMIYSTDSIANMNKVTADQGTATMAAASSAQSMFTLQNVSLSPTSMAKSLPIKASSNVIGSFITNSGVRPFDCYTEITLPFGKMQDLNLSSNSPKAHLDCVTRTMPSGDIDTYIYPSTKGTSNCEHIAICNYVDSDSQVKDTNKESVDNVRYSPTKLKKVLMFGDKSFTILGSARSPSFNTVSPTSSTTSSLSTAHATLSALLSAASVDASVADFK